MNGLRLDGKLFIRVKQGYYLEYDESDFLKRLYASIDIDTTRIKARLYDEEP